MVPSWWRGNLRRIASGILNASSRRGPPADPNAPPCVASGGMPGVCAIVQGSKVDRRRFLAAMGTATAATGASAVLLPVTTVEAQAYDPGADERRARYQANADDVKAFYRTNGYETLKK